MQTLIKPPLKFLWQAFTFRKLLTGIKSIHKASLAELRNVDFLTNLIREIGLKFDSRGAYGQDQQYMNLRADGLWQVPRQLARTLVCLSDFPIKTFLEIGTSVGWTSTLMTAYLVRFNPDLKATTVDPANYFRFYKFIRNRLPLDYALGRTSEDFKGQAFDLCFIDGDHSFEWCSKDYENVGAFSKICMFHDINDDYVSTIPENHGGVRRFWNLLKEREAASADFHAFTDHSTQGNFLGIGLRVKESAKTL